ncbi:MAG: FAD-dependent oxidoreductase [Halanaerobiaceae bacterium]
MYTKEMKELIKKVEATRDQRAGVEFPRMNPKEKEEVLNNFHPDYNSSGFVDLKIGPSKGQAVPEELGEILEAYSCIKDIELDLNAADYQADILIIGGGGAGAAAALEAKKNGAEPLLVTKLRFGDANTMMAQGGIQAADKPEDSPADHYIDAMGGGHYKNIPELVKALVMDGPEIISWLENMGIMFNKEENGSMETFHGGGTSKMRAHSARDYSGAEIMRVLRDEVYNNDIEVVEFAPAVELLIDDDGRAAGAVLFNLETEEYYIARANKVIMATGGSGRLHYQGFPTTNHYGATGDGLILSYRAGAELIYPDTIQYHPTGVAYPPQIQGSLVTEKVRGLGGTPLNINGEQFVNPLETRDVEAAAIIRECKGRNLGIETPTGMVGVWLDTPLIERIHGKGTIEKQLPAMHRRYLKYNIDMRKQPLLVYPTLHYQNGGILINENGETSIENLYVAGETAGGIHGHNRLMGNSLLDILVFGRRAGRDAAKRCHENTPGKPGLKHLDRYHNELKNAGIPEDRKAPKLLPEYSHKKSS